VHGRFGGAWQPEQGGHDRSRTWENVYDDGSRIELLPRAGELMRLDECGPSPGRDPYVL
jgi:hypothetical protein